MACNPAHSGMLIMILTFSSLAFGSVPGERARELTFDFRYSVIFENEGHLEAWVPLPSSNPFQTITRLQIETNLEFTLVEDTLYGNRMVYVNTRLSGPDSLSVTFRAYRKEAAGIPRDISPTQSRLCGRAPCNNNLT